MTGIRNVAVIPSLESEEELGRGQSPGTLGPSNLSPAQDPSHLQKVYPRATVPHFQEAPLGADWLLLFFWIYGESNTRQKSGEPCLQKQLGSLQSQLLEMWLSGPLLSIHEAPGSDPSAANRSVRDSL